MLSHTLSHRCLAIIANTEVIAVNQDALGIRGKLVLQWYQRTRRCGHQRLHTEELCDMLRAGRSPRGHRQIVPSAPTLLMPSAMPSATPALEGHLHPCHQAAPR
jgi:hypothetical protein